MTLGPVSRAAAGGLTRRRVQTIVIGLVLLVSTGACVLALALVADSSTPFDHAFAAQRGAHVIAVVNPARATAADLAATRRRPEVTAAAGPFGEVTVTPKFTGPDGAQVQMSPMLVAGRASPGGAMLLVRNSGLCSCTTAGTRPRSCVGRGLHIAARRCQPCVNGIAR